MSRALRTSITMRTPRESRGTISRRDLLGSACIAGGAYALAGLLPAWARSGGGASPPPDPRTGPQELDLVIAETPVEIGGRTGTAVTLNGGIPGPLLRFKEGETVTLRVHNRLREPTSIHWHGILLPYRMDGVPGVSFPGIPAGETFTYRYKVQQSGTYWYHSHLGLQEQLGHYGPIVARHGPDHHGAGAASVFFRTPEGRVAASAESLIAALDWLVGAGARVVNVSLAGPPNRLLEEAVDRARAHGLLLVAAVGNEGPAAPPRYPAAYPSTIAVTALDARLDPYVRAGRGSHVDFAAPGVEIVVAGPDGPAIRSGTSIAAPFVTALLAVHPGTMSAKHDTRRLVLDLAASAQDLGPPGFDPVFGHGLVRAPLGVTQAAGKVLR